MYATLHDTADNLTWTASNLGTDAILSLNRVSSEYADVTSSQLRFNSSSFAVEA